MNSPEFASTLLHTALVLSLFSKDNVLLLAETISSPPIKESASPIATLIAFKSSGFFEILQCI